MNKVVKEGLVEQLRVLKIYLNEYEREIKGKIIPFDDYCALNALSNNLYRKLTLESINEEKEKDADLWLK